MKITMLDCTLRDGGYVNDWKFGEYNIRSVLRGLIASGVDIVECGYLADGVEPDGGRTMFPDMSRMEALIGEAGACKTEFAVMIDFGKYRIENLPQYTGGPIRIIRLAFHKKDAKKALEAVQIIREKGYKVFLQPMVSMCYSEAEFLELVREANEVRPDAFYIVDSFGVMKKRDLLHLFEMVKNNLSEDVLIGYHSHNNMQLAYSNAQALVEANAGRAIIIDASVMGMGRGAGNLNTELFAEYLNDAGWGTYEIQPLLQISDKVLGAIYAKQYWGYSLAYYVSAVNQCHPNYASYLSKKNNLTVDEINTLLRMLSEEKKIEFDADYIETLYVEFMSQSVAESGLGEIMQALRGKKILVIAPGRSSVTEKETIQEFAKQADCVTISVNHLYEFYDADYVFFSNIRRFKSNDLPANTKIIVTSNIKSEHADVVLRYPNLLNNCEGVRDNAGMMLLRFLTQMPIEGVYLAGMDGYSLDAEQNYSSDKYILNSQKEVILQMNKGMSYLIEQYSKEIKIEFLTARHFIGV